MLASDGVKTRCGLGGKSRGDRNGGRGDVREGNLDKQQHSGGVQRNAVGGQRSRDSSEELSSKYVVVIALPVIILLSVGASSSRDSRAQWCRKRMMVGDSTAGGRLIGVACATLMLVHAKPPPVPPQSTATPLRGNLILSNYSY